jgi:hypothetical protein
VNPELEAPRVAGSFLVAGNFQPPSVRPIPESPLCKYVSYRDIEISEDEIAVCEKTAGLMMENLPDLNSVYSKVLVPVKLFQLQDMLNKNRFL